VKAQVPDALTLAEAVNLLDPPMPLRTLQSRVQAAERRNILHHVAVRPSAGKGGRPAREYRAFDLFQIHRDWVLSTQGKRPGADVA
jgi:hypothetical protein